MKEPLNQMLVTDIKDPQAQDNFNKLNLLFKGEFPVKIGRLPGLTVVNLTATPVTWALSWERVGYRVTLHFDDDITGTKAGVTTPQLIGKLPIGLLPRRRIIAPWVLQNNAANAAGYINISIDGTVSWAPVAGWTAAAAATIYSAAITYLGN